MSSSVKGFLVGVIVTLAIVLGAVAYPTFKKDQTEPQTTTTSIQTTEPQIEHEYPPVASQTGWIGPEHFQWDYHYNYEEKLLNINEQFIGGVDGWGDGYPMDYASAVDGLYWDDTLKNYPLIIMTFNDDEGFYDDFLFAFHPKILSQEITQIIVKGSGTIYYEDGSSTPYQSSESYSFKVANHKLVEYQKDADTKVFYDYDSQGRLSKITTDITWDNDGIIDSRIGEVFITYEGEQGIFIDSRWNDHGFRQWKASLNDKAQVTSLEFREAPYGDENIDQMEFAPVELEYDENGYLIKSTGHNASGIHYDISHITYNEDHLLTSFYKELFDDTRVLDEYKHDFYYTHQTPRIEKPTTFESEEF